MSGRLSTCGVTRLLVVAFLAGFGVSTMTGSEPLAWVAAAVAVGLVLAAQRIRGTAASCPIPPS